MAAVGDSNPTFSALQEALKQAQGQAQARPVEDRIVSTKVFIVRAKKRVTVCREEVSCDAGGPCTGADEVAVRRARVGRRGGTFGGSYSGECDECGGATSCSTCQFRPRIGRVARLRSGIATRGPRFAIPVAVHRRTRCRRATAQTAQEFVLFYYRFSAHEPRPGGSDGAWDWTKFAFDERRPLRIVSQNGDTDRQCRGEFAFESVQPTLKLMGFKSARVQARYGMRGVRVGEASHPGPPGDSATLSTAIDSPTRIEHALEFDLTQRDSDSEVVTASCSDTETIAIVVGSVRARPQCSAASGVSSGGRVVPHIGSQDRVGPSWFRDPQSRSFATVVSH